MIWRFEDDWRFVDLKMIWRSRGKGSVSQLNIGWLSVLRTVPATPSLLISYTNKNKLNKIYTTHKLGAKVELCHIRNMYFFGIFL